MESFFFFFLGGTNEEKKKNLPALDGRLGLSDMRRRPDGMGGGGGVSSDGWWAADAGWTPLEGVATPPPPCGCIVMALRMVAETSAASDGDRR